MTEEKVTGAAVEGREVDSDPGSLRRRIETATGLLNATAAALTDDQAREQSLLPGWSRGHVLTHLARNADGLRNLLIWARTGVETPQYPSRDAREPGRVPGDRGGPGLLGAGLAHRPGLRDEAVGQPRIRCRPAAP